MSPEPAYPQTRRNEHLLAGTEVHLLSVSGSGNGTLLPVASAKVVIVVELEAPVALIRSVHSDVSKTKQRLQKAG
jgi:hypothetical protein